MPTALERAIDQLSDPDTALPDALRSLLVVARRIKATELADWILHEMNGYGGEELPPYRDLKGAPVRLDFVGPFGSSGVVRLSTLELPEPLRGTDGLGQVRTPLGELVALTCGDSDPQLSFPVAWVTLYRHYMAKGEAVGFAGMELNTASIEFPRTLLQGVLDRIRTAALDLALNIEDISTDMGDVRGSSVDENPQLARVIQAGMVQIFNGNAVVTVADQATTAVGKGATAIQVAAGDIASLLSAAADYLDHDGVRALADALEADGGAPGPQTKSFLENVRSGIFTIAGGMAASGAYDGLLALIASAFPNGTLQ